MVTRKVIRINEDLCNGCGDCTIPCVETAIEIVNGKARVISDDLCDGAGTCMDVCAWGALTIEDVDTEPFKR